MVERFKIILNKLVRLHGPVYIFAISQMDDLVDKWTVILSAPWITSENNRQTFEEIRKLMIEHLSPEELTTIARIGLWSKDEHLIQLLLQYQKDVVIENQKINGNNVYKGYILESNPNPSQLQPGLDFDSNKQPA